MQFSDRPATYQIRVLGLLDPQWADWFDGFAFAYVGAETWLTGLVIDQAALHGLIDKLGDLGLVLLSLQRLEHDGSPPSAEQACQPTERLAGNQQA